jgi:tight adherence protein C
MVSFTDRWEFVLYVAYALIFGAAFLVSRMLLQEGETLAAAEKLSDKDRKKSKNGIVNLTRPFFVQYIVPMISGKPFWESQRKSWKSKLISAGLNDEFTPDEFISFKLFMIVFFPIMGGILNALDLLSLSAPLFLGLAVVGFFYPDFWIRSRVKSRQKEILKSMPFIVDLLALSTEAGLDFIGAIQKVVEKAAPGPLVDEFGQLLREIRLGTSRQEALREMALRVGMQEFRSFATILISADQMGSSIGGTLRAQSETIRSNRMLRAEKAGAAAASKVMIPIIFFVVPAVLLMVGAPFLLRFIYPDGN